MSARVVPYHCPYCGEEDLRPYEEGPGGDAAAPGGDTPAATGRGAWHCHDCTRVFTVKYHGTALPLPAAMPTGNETDRPPESE